MSTNIDRLRIATPCPVSWEQMTGDNRVRFCEQCQLNVYNISELSRIETESLIASTEGRICARLYRRVDGTVLTKDCPVGLRALRMRVSKRGAAVFAAIASLASMVFGQQPSAKDGKTACTPQTRITRTNAPSDLAGQSLSGMVVDPAGGAVPGAKVTLRSTDAKKIGTTSSNETGIFEFASLAAGAYSITIELTGFKSLKIERLIVEKDKLTKLDLVLELSSETILVGIVDTSVFDRPPPGTTIISGDIIRRLPIQY